jgi:hypothetical protein
MATRQLTIELIAIRAVIELPESPSPEASERSDEFTADVLRAFRPLAKCPAMPSAARKVGT